MSDQLRDQVFDPALWKSLAQELKVSPYAMEFIRLTCMGLRPHKVARLVHRNYRTVEAHRCQVSTKVGASGGLELVSQMLLRAFGKYLERRGL